MVPAKLWSSGESDSKHDTTYDPTKPEFISAEAGRVKNPSTNFETT